MAGAHKEQSTQERRCREQSTHGQSTLWGEHIRGSIKRTQRDNALVDTGSGGTEVTTSS